MENPIVRLRRELGMSQEELGDAIGKSASLIRQYEITPGPENLRKLAEVADQHNRHDLALEFRQMAGDVNQGIAGVDLRELSRREVEIASVAVYMMRHPATPSDEAIIQLLEYQRTVLASKEKSNQAI